MPPLIIYFTIMYLAYIQLFYLLLYDIFMGATNEPSLFANDLTPYT